MTAQRFNPLTYANKLKEAGVPAKQAEVQAQLQEEIIYNVDVNILATKKDINDLKNDINNLKLATKSEINELKDLIYSNTWKVIAILGTLQGIFIGILGAFQMIIHFYK